jgi:hypothetical protein
MATFPFRVMASEVLVVGLPLVLTHWACADTKQHRAAAERSSFFILLEKRRVKKYVE